MEKIKEFVKENWIWIVGGILLATIILYLANRKQKKDILKNPGGAINKGKLVPTTETLSLSALKAKLDECNKKNANARIGGGAVGPCGLLQDQYNAALKNTESSYSYNTRAVSKKPRMCKYPDGTPVPCDAMELSYGGGQFAGAFDKTNGLNVTDFAMGMEGTALLEDKNL